MNGMITIELGGVSTPLTFGMLAIEEFGNRQSIGNTGWAKLMTDLIYAGYCNEEVIEGRNPALTYRDIAVGVESLIIEKSSVINDVYTCFEQSKAGAELMGAVKKKLEVEPEIQKATRKKKQTGTKSKDLPMES